MGHIHGLMGEGAVVYRQTNTDGVTKAARDLCSGHTVVESFCIAQHLTKGGKIDRWIHVLAPLLPQLVEETPSWVFGMCEAVRAIATRKTDLIAFYYPDGSRRRIGIDWIPDENMKEWRTLRWIDEGGISSVIRSGEGSEEPVEATAIILYNFLKKGECTCNYTGVGDPTDPLLVAGALSYHLFPYVGGNWLFRLTLCDLSDAYLAKR